MTGFIASSGFEWLFEQEMSESQARDCLARVGFVEGAAYVSRAYAIVGAGPERPPPWAEVHAKFDDLKSLLHAYFDQAQPRLLSCFGDYVRAHRAAFAGVTD